MNFFLITALLISTLIQNVMASPCTPYKNKIEMVTKVISQ